MCITTVPLSKTQRLCLNGYYSIHNNTRIKSQGCFGILSSLAFQWALKLCNYHYTTSWNCGRSWRKLEQANHHRLKFKLSSALSVATCRTYNQLNNKLLFQAVMTLCRQNIRQIRPRSQLVVRTLLSLGSDICTLFSTFNVKCFPISHIMGLGITY